MPLNKEILEGIEGLGVIDSCKNPYRILFTLFKKGKISRSEMTRRCNLAILKNCEKMEYRRPPSKPQFKITKGEVEKNGYPEEYWSWAKRMRGVKVTNHKNKARLEEAIHWFSTNTNTLEDVPRELIERAEKVLETYPEDKTSDHIV